MHRRTTNTVAALAALVLSSLLAMAAISGCAYRQTNPKGVVEADFIEPVSAEARTDLAAQIDSLKNARGLDPRNADIHRRLAVLYRLEGTPHSRLLSTEEIEHAISIDPFDPELLVEKGLTLLARRLVGDAEDCFVQATVLDKGCFDAWFQLGRMEQYEYYKTMCFPNHLIKSIDYFEKANRLNRKNEDALINLGFLWSFRQMYGTGLKYASRAVLFYPKDYRPHLLAGLLETRLKDFDKAEKEYALALLLMSDEERKPYENISYLLSPDERELYLSSTPEKRRDWNRRFWIENDPTPATDVNERQLEHFNRVVIADWTLSDERLGTRGSQTDRGGALIRYGLPDKKYYDLGTGTSGAWVVWEYALAGGAFRLYYFDEFLNGNYHYPVTDAYGEMSLNLVDRIPQRYQFPVAYASVPMNVEVAEMRGEHERTKIEFSVALPDSLRRGKGGAWDLYITFFDESWTRYSRDRVSFSPDTLPVIDRLKGRYIVLNLGLEMMPRESRSTCVVEAVGATQKLKAARRYPIDIKEMYGRSLKLSSVKFTIPGAGGTCSSMLDPIPAYPEKSVLCLNYEIYNLKADERNQARYRLTYAIRNPGPSAEASSPTMQKTLSYMWSSIRGGKAQDKPYVTSTIEQSASGSTASDNLQINLGTLEKGTYLLALEVEDLVTGMRATESRLFNVTD
jgi:GWxTD domain-containing protein